jgi:hypothetical protein
VSQSDIGQMFNVGEVVDVRGIDDAGLVVEWEWFGNNIYYKIAFGDGSSGWFGQDFLCDT